MNKEMFYASVMIPRTGNPKRRMDQTAIFPDKPFINGITVNVTVQDTNEQVFIRYPVIRMGQIQPVRLQKLFFIITKDIAYLLINHHPAFSRRNYRHSYFPQQKKARNFSSFSFKAMAIRFR